MEEILDPVLGCEIAYSVETRDAHRAGSPVDYAVVPSTAC
jgi:hypothetical protein